MFIYAYAAALQLVDETVDCRMIVIARYDDCFYGNIPFPEIVDDAERVGIVCDAEIGTDFLAFDITGIDADHHIDLVLQTLKKLEFDIRVKTGKNPCRMEIVSKFASEFEVKFIVEAARPLENLLRLLLKIQRIVKTDFTHILPPDS